MAHQCDELLADVQAQKAQRIADAMRADRERAIAKQAQLARMLPLIGREPMYSPRMQHAFDSHAPVYDDWSWPTNGVTMPAP